MHTARVLTSVLTKCEWDSHVTDRQTDRHTDVRVSVGLIGQVQGPVLGCCEHGDELPSCTKCRNEQFVGISRNVEPG
jgi:hypothetical protein